MFSWVATMRNALGSLCVCAVRRPMCPFTVLCSHTPITTPLTAAASDPPCTYLLLAAPGARGVCACGADRALQERSSRQIEVKFLPGNYVG